MKRRADGTPSNGPASAEVPSNAMAESRGEGRAAFPASPVRNKRPAPAATKKSKTAKLSANDSPHTRDSDVEIQEREGDPPESCPICKCPCPQKSSGRLFKLHHPCPLSSWPTS